MRASTGTRVRHWLPLCALVFALVGMHHLVLPPQGTSHGAPAGEAHVAAPVESSQPDDPEGDHDLMHACPAVLHVTGGFLPHVWLWTAVDSAEPTPTTLLVTHLFPPPRPAGRSLLTSVCVLRT